MDALELLTRAVDSGTSDIFIVAGCPITFKIKGNMTNYSDEIARPELIEKLIGDIYGFLQGRKRSHLLEMGEDDFSFSIPKVGRFRANVYFQRGSMAAVLRVVRFELPDPTELGIPQDVIQFSELKKGLVLITGAAGSGKSTTLACIIEEINKNRRNHIVTIEDPIEYLHPHKQSIVSQREISQDTADYIQALKAALREAPDVILVGEMRDLETIQTVLSAAETGHLVFSTLHTVGAANTINRIIDVFPSSRQQQVRVQLAMVLQAIVSQQLVPTSQGNQIPAFEIMKVNTAIQTQIRENKIHQIDNIIASSRQLGMVTMDAFLQKMVQDGKITKDVAIGYSTDPEMMAKRVG